MDPVLYDFVFVISAVCSFGLCTCVCMYVIGKRKYKTKKQKPVNGEIHLETVRTNSNSAEDSGSGYHRPSLQVRTPTAPPMPHSTSSHNIFQQLCNSVASTSSNSQNIFLPLCNSSNGDHESGSNSVSNSFGQNLSLPLGNNSERNNSSNNRNNSSNSKNKPIRIYQNLLYSGNDTPTIITPTRGSQSDNCETQTIYENVPSNRSTSSSSNNENQNIYQNLGSNSNSATTSSNNHRERSSGRSRNGRSEGGKHSKNSSSKIKKSKSNSSVLFSYTYADDCEGSSTMPNLPNFPGILPQTVPNYINNASYSGPRPTLATVREDSREQEPEEPVSRDDNPRSHGQRSRSYDQLRNTPSSGNVISGSTVGAPSGSLDLNLDSNFEVILLSPSTPPPPYCEGHPIAIL